MTSRRLFALVFIALLAVVTAENLGTPRNAGPDEPAHIVRGAGLVRGQVTGESYGDWLIDQPPLDAGGADIANADADSDAVRVFDVPRWVAQPSATCYAHRPEQPAGCSTIDGSNVDGSDVGGSGVGGSGDGASPRDGALSTAASYPIWGHLLPGLATLAISGSSALWLARFLHALVPVALIAATLAGLIGRGRRTASSALLVATTPMVLFLLAVVNPSGIAVAGAIALWVAGDEAFRTGRASSWLLVGGFAALVLPRDDGLIWAALVVAVLALVWRRSPVVLWRVLGNPARVLVAATAVVGAAWAAVARGELVPVDRPATGWEFAGLVVARTGRHLREAVGVLGWLDTQIPESMFALWCFTAGLVVMVPLVARNYRRAVGAAVALGLFVGVAWVLEIVQGRSAGLFWQGRYGLPMLIGVVLVAGLTDDAERTIGEVAAIVPGLLALVVWNMSFLQQLRRWGVGEGGSIRPWAWNTWDAPVPILLLIVVHIAASAALGWLCWSGRTNGDRYLADRPTAGR